jgi:hypothetical protein
VLLLLVETDAHPPQTGGWAGSHESDEGVPCTVATSAAAFVAWLRSTTMQQAATLDTPRDTGLGTVQGRMGARRKKLREALSAYGFLAPTC